MPLRKHGGAERRDAGTERAAAPRGIGAVRRLRERLRRALRRECATGMLTMDPDGKLTCETWRTERGRTD
jgi:hypothetical protein